MAIRALRARTSAVRQISIAVDPAVGQTTSGVETVRSALSDWFVRDALARARDRVNGAEERLRIRFIFDATVANGNASIIIIFHRASHAVFRVKTLLAQKASTGQENALMMMETTFNAKRVSEIAGWESIDTNALDAALATVGLVRISRHSHRIPARVR